KRGDARAVARAEPPIVALVGGSARAGEELLELEVEAEVVVRDRQARGQPGGGGERGRTRQGAGPPEQAMRDVGGIAAEELVAAVAAERDGDVTAREAREQIGGHDRAVGDRLVEDGAELADDARRLVDGEALFVVARAEV